MFRWIYPPHRHIQAQHILSIAPLTLRLADIVPIQVLDGLPEELEPKVLSLVLALPQALVEPPHRVLTETELEILEEVGRVLVASVPGWVGRKGGRVLIIGMLCIKGRGRGEEGGTVETEYGENQKNK